MPRRDFLHRTKWDEIVLLLDPEAEVEGAIAEEAGEKIVEGLVRLEDSLVTRRHKIGVLYCGQLQNEEGEMLGNRQTSPEYEEFLQVLGSRVELQGFEGYAGGLDTENGATGATSLYTTYQNVEIMYHVATFLPFQNEGGQWLEKKRHIGNDMGETTFVRREEKSVFRLVQQLRALEVGSGELGADLTGLDWGVDKCSTSKAPSDLQSVVIFSDSALPFSPTALVSHFNHVFYVVSPERQNGQTAFRVECITMGDVPKFGPPLPSEAFTDRSLLRQFLLTKLINGERACLQSSQFLPRNVKTRAILLTHHMKENPVVRPKRLHSSHSLKQMTLSPRGQHLKRSKSISDLTEPFKAQVLQYAQKGWKAAHLDQDVPRMLSCLLINDQVYKEASSLLLALSSLLGLPAPSPALSKLESLAQLFEQLGDSHALVQILKLTQRGVLAPILVHFIRSINSGVFTDLSWKVRIKKGRGPGQFLVMHEREEKSTTKGEDWSFSWRLVFTVNVKDGQASVQDLLVQVTHLTFNLIEKSSRKNVQRALAGYLVESLRS